MKNPYLMAFLLIPILVPFVSATEFSRSLSPDPVAPDQTVTVTLDVILDPDVRFYIIDDIYPPGFEVVSADAGSADHIGHVKYAVFKDAASTAYNYTLRAPAEAGEYEFSGTFSFDGQAGGPQAISGDSGISVSPGNDWIWSAAILIIIIAVFVFILARKGLLRRPHGAKARKISHASTKGPERI